MAFFRGEEGSVKFKNSSAGNAETIVSTTGWSLDITKDTLDVTSHGKTSREFVGGLISGSGTIDFLYTAADVGNSDAGIDATGKILADILTTEDPADASFELFLDTSGAKKLSFNGIVTGSTLSATTGDLETVSVSFITSGDITNAA